jgi:NTE family protein
MSYKTRAPDARDTADSAASTTRLARWFRRPFRRRPDEGKRVIGHMEGKHVGLALSGGGALGAAHIGVLEVLVAHGIRPYCLSGTSAGSAVGSLYSAGLSLSLIKEVALSLDWTKLGRVVRPRRGFFDGGRLEQYLIRLIGDRKFDQLITPFACAAVDILRDELVILREGRVAPAVRASCAFPGVFTPVVLGERLLVDGGLINNMPVGVLREMGAEYLIAVDLSSSTLPRKPPNSLLEMWFMSLSTLTRLTHHEGALANVVICPDIGEFNGIDLGGIPRLIERGREAAERALPRILSDLGLEADLAG